jgi:hypothetical protein
MVSIVGLKLLDREKLLQPNLASGMCFDEYLPRNKGAGNLERKIERIFGSWARSPYLILADINHSYCADYQDSL